MNQENSAVYTSNSNSIDQKRLNVICMLINMVLLVFDLLIPLGVAVGALYLLPILVVSKVLDENLIKKYTVLSTVFIVIAYFVSPEGGEGWKVLLNRVISLFIVWVTCILSIKNIVSQRKYMQLSKAIEQSPAASIITDPKGVIQYVNNAFTKITGYSREDVIGETPKILNSGKNNSGVYQEMWNVLSNKQTWRGELVNKHKNGRLVNVLLTVSPVLNDAQEVVSYISTELDVSELKQTLSALGRSELRFETLVSSAPICIHEIDSSGKLSSMNPAGLKMMGVENEDEVIGLEYCQLPRESLYISKMMKEALAGIPSFFEFTTLKDGKLTYYESNFIPVFDKETDKVERLMGVSQDITKRKLAEFKLNDALVLAQSGDRVKQEFLSIISHELRTPLNGIIGGIDLLDGVDEEVVDILRESSERMQSTLEEILSFIAITKEDVNVVTVQFNLKIIKKALKKRLDNFAAYREKINEIEMDWSGWDCKCRTDPVILEVILWNLLNNAVKFTDSGYIRLKVSPFENGLTISIADSGRGVAKDRQAEIFDEFAISEDSISRSNDGLGLGLAVCQKYVSILGGELFLESSAEGEGAHFKLHLNSVI